MRQLKFKYYFENIRYSGLYTQVFTLEEISNGYVKEFINDHVEYKEKHISQFSGLLDKQGVEIYEGDIISSLERYYCDRSNRDWVGIIKENNYGGLALTYEDDSYPDEFGELMEPVNDPQTASFLIQSCEVIGNIYENPDLLEFSTVSTIQRKKI